MHGVQQIIPRHQPLGCGLQVDINKFDSQSICFLTLQPSFYLAYEELVLPQSHLDNRTLDYVTHFLSTNLSRVKLPPYHNYDAHNTTFFRPSLLYNKGN